MPSSKGKYSEEGTPSEECSMGTTIHITVRRIATVGNLQAQTCLYVPVRHSRALD